jgi:hypothetical protein
MPDIETFTGAYGFPIVIDTNLDLTDATALKLKIKSPSGSTVSRDLALEDITDVEAGIVTYTVGSTDFTVPGLFKIQLVDEVALTKKIISGIIKVRVRPSVEYVGP